MSAINVIRQRDRVVLVTDGAVWDVNAGIIRGFPAKQATLPSLPAVFATRGAPLATPVFAFLLDYRFRSFDALIAGIEAAIPDIHAQVKLTCRGDTDSPLVIAGWSHDRNRPEAYLIRTTEDAFGATLEETAEVTAEAIQPAVYKRHALGSVTYSPFVPREAYEQTGISAACEDMDEPALLRHLTALLELQRRNFYRSPKGEPFSGVGGYALATIVTADGVTQKV